MKKESRTFIITSVMILLPVLAWMVLQMVGVAKGLLYLDYRHSCLRCTCFVWR